MPIIPIYLPTPPIKKVIAEPMIITKTDEMTIVTPPKSESINAATGWGFKLIRLEVVIHTYKNNFVMISW